MEKSSTNHGMTKTSSKRGQSIRTDYGRDNSDVSGSTAEERGGKRGGGVKNLAHSIPGSSAK